MIRTAALTLGVATAALAYAVPAAATSPSDILGVWCGYGPDRVPVTYNFSRESFTVTWHDSNERRVNRIARLEFAPTTIRVYWFDRNTETWTEFGQFSRDGRHMLQLPGKGPARAWYRC